ncbi:n(G),N(G)-dimethylarginine dimethylaminohydrolase 1 family protein [Trichinella nativa]|uniref:N(G),N(G)-dimethylarginine dimethylaminohydrolase 1 family protein n=1 Tax=Trichinella nativa TaxID=6335 RepID=A0A1Y3EA94_9BILA|nr:n(G),N(G)-dimethylarginine dimethylaminohydrolase 1 family protein [Trichinella nativa]
MPRYTHAILTRLPNRLELNGKTLHVDLTGAKRQQEELTEKLRDAGVNVIELAPEDVDELSSLFVDDYAIVCNGTALMTPERPGFRTREVVALLLELGFQVKQADTDNTNLKLRGSDVLFTGKEFFVGITSETNLAGAKLVAKSFPEYPTTAFKLQGSHPLKYYVCTVLNDVLAVGKSNDAQNTLKKIENEAVYKYTTLTLNDDNAVNCFNLNGTIFTGMHNHGIEVSHIYLFGSFSDKSIFFAFEKFQSIQECELQSVAVDELLQFGGLLTQHCLLLKKMKSPKNA